MVELKKASVTHFKMTGCGCHLLLRRHRPSEIIAAILRCILPPTSSKCAFLYNSIKRAALTTKMVA